MIEKSDSAGVESTSQPSPRSSPSMVTRVATGLAVVLLISLFLSRSFAQRFDFSVANILTLILGFTTWLAFLLALKSSRLPRIAWRSLGLAPLVVVGGCLAMYRVVRIDGELVPQLEWRWKASEALPQLAAEQTQSEATSLATPRPTDFPQYLGPRRNGSVEGVTLDTDWNTHPPEILWKQPIGAGWSGFAVQGDLAVTLEQREQEQWITAYEVESGKLVWQSTVAGYHFNALGGAGPRSTPTLANGRVYAHMNSGHVVCLELASGAKVWETDLFKLVGWDQAAAESKVSWGRSGSPLVVDDKLIVPLGGPKPDSGALVALSLADGKPIWRAGSDQISYSSPARMTLMGVDQIVIVNEATITGHTIASGQVLWTVPWLGQSTAAANVSQPIALDDERLFISKGYSQGCQLVKFTRAPGSDEPWPFEIVWKQLTTMKTKFTNAVVRGQYAYGLSDGILECIDLKTGGSQWKRGRYRQGQLLLVGDVLLITAENGSVVLVGADPNHFQELAKLQVIGDVTWNPPALSGNRLLIRNADEAACLRLPLK